MNGQRSTHIEIFDCGCVINRPKEASCKSYGTRFRIYTSINKDGVAIKLLLKCRDCGRMRHFVLQGNNPVLIQYLGKDLIDLDGGIENGESKI